MTQDNVLHVQMLGTFSITLGNARVDDSSNRSKKIWLLLAYLIYNRDRTVSQEELIRLLWGDEEENDNPAGALKTAFWRARQMLEPLGHSLGKEAILRKGGGCRWNPAIPTELDTEEFERLIHAAHADEDPEERLNKLYAAVTLYEGNFLNKMDMEPWVSPISAYYQHVYTSALMEVLPIFESQNRFQEAESLCQRAMKEDPYNEILHQYYLRSIASQGDYARASAAY
jgi:DNA-binding SARP family transcriptional activator